MLEYYNLSSKFILFYMNPFEAFVICCVHVAFN